MPIETNITQNRLRVVFIGTPDFAVASLKALLQDNANVVAVITAPDRPAGRGLKLQTSAVKDFAVENGLPVLQPNNLKSEKFIEELASYKADIQIVIAFRMLPVAVWNMPKYGTFNLHASLLPAYRGAAPINWAIMNGDKETGLTTFFLKHEIDTGNILFQEKVEIWPEDTAGELHDRLMLKGAGLVVKTLKAIEKGDYPQIPQQSDDTAPIAPKLFKENCRINWDAPAYEVKNHIRGLSPYPGAWTTLDGKTLKVFSAGIADKSDQAVASSQCDGKKFLRVSTKDAWIELLFVQLEGKKKMNIEEFLRGYSGNFQID